MIRLLSKFSSSIRCAAHPVMRLMANSGVKTSLGSPINFVNESGIEVDVRANSFIYFVSFEIHEVFDGALFEQLEESELLFAAFLPGQIAGHLLQQQRAGVGDRINGVSDAVDQPAFVVYLFA